MPGVRVRWLLVRFGGYGWACARVHTDKDTHPHTHTHAHMHCYFICHATYSVTTVTHFVTNARTHLCCKLWH